MFGRLLSWYIIHFRRLLPSNGILPGAKFILRPSLAFSYIGSVIALHSSSGRQPNFAALSRGRHLYWAGRPSRLATAHILVANVFTTRATALQSNSKRNSRRRPGLHCGRPFAVFFRSELVATLRVNRFGSWTYNGFQVDLDMSPDDNAVDLSSYDGNCYPVTHHASRKNVQYYECCEEPYPDITITLQLLRTD